MHLTGAPDERSLLTGAAFSSKGAYDALASQLADPNLVHIWDSRVPSRVRVFGWLFYIDRLNTQANLCHKSIIESSSCPRCDGAPEDRAHLFFTCPAAVAIWDALGLQPVASPLAELWSTPCHPTLPQSVWPFILLLLLWKIWDARNKKVFQGLDIDASVSFRAILDDLILWMHRLKSETLKGHTSLWRDFLSSRNT